MVHGLKEIGGSGRGDLRSLKRRDRWEINREGADNDAVEHDPLKRHKAGDPPLAADRLARCQHRVPLFPFRAETNLQGLRRAAHCPGHLLRELLPVMLMKRLPDN